MTIAAKWLTLPETQAVCRMLEDAGHQALFVGGCVRNELLEEPVGDIDIATDAVPESVMALAKSAGLKPIPTGIEHGTITVVSRGLPHEITTFRRDVETDGRRATVAYATDIAEDARRRDFTMNALYARSDGAVIDPLGGLPDLMARRVRFIENPEDRIREDYLRILRFFRFHAWYGQGGLDADGLAACAMLADGMTQLSRERVGAETLKLLGAPDPAPSVAAMRMAGVLARVLPGADDTFLAPLVHVEQGLGVSPGPLRRLAVLGGEDATDRFRLSKAQARQLDLLRTGMGAGFTACELGYRHGVDTGRDILLLCATMENRMVNNAEMSDLALGAGARFPVVATDLMPGLEGPALGRKLQDLETRWIASRFKLSKRDLLG